MSSHKKTIKVLIIEDHKVVIEAYSNILKTSTIFNFDFKYAINCDEAIKELNLSNKDLVLLDLQLPASYNEKFISGEDIGLWIRKASPNTKILISTSISDSERVRSIIKTINPEGFLIKSDIDPIDIVHTAEAILNSKTYYSKTIKDYIHNSNSVNGQVIDDIDRKILYHLSMGEKTKDLPKLVHISLRAVEGRKVKLKVLLSITKNTDGNLIKEAKRRNII